MQSKPPLSEFLHDHSKTAHLIGIGGVSMYSLAETMQSMGIPLTGSDLHESDTTREIEQRGIPVLHGHFAQNVQGKDYIIRTAAVHDDNPEIVAARDAGIPVYERAEAWGAIMRRYKNALCVAGTHGKTTTTSMLTHIVMASGADPTVMIGGQLPLLNGAHRVGKGNTIILEACEYCNSFLSFAPTVAVILNVEEDHLDFFKDINDLKKSFGTFASLVPKAGGTVVVNADDRNAMDCVKGLDRKILTFSLTGEADLTASHIRYQRGLPEFDLLFRGNLLTRVRLLVPGKHNIANALAAAAAALAIECPISAISEGLASFPGAARRFEYKGEYNGAVICDDYAHHPSELHALFDTVCEMNFERIICAFQPHTFSRTKAFFDDFVRELSRPDILVLADIFAAREKNTLGIDSTTLAGKIEGARYLPDFNDMVDFLAKTAQPGDVILTVGAGELNRVSEALAKRKPKPKRHPADGFMQGVEIGGLRTDAEVKIMICYLLKTIGKPVSRNAIDCALQQDGLANYWMISQSLAQLCDTGSVTAQTSGSETLYSLTSIGRECADELETSLPISVREKAVSQILLQLTKERARENKSVEIVKTDVGYEVHCRIVDNGVTLLSLSLFAADSMQAALIKDRFLICSSEVYQQILETLF